MRLEMLGRIIVAPLLAPGELCCNLMGVADEGTRDLVRMLANSLAWMVLGVVAVIGVWGQP